MPETLGGLEDRQSTMLKPVLQADVISEEKAAIE
jgi:hypothetical protein